MSEDLKPIQNEQIEEKNESQSFINIKETLFNNDCAYLYGIHGALQASSLQAEQKVELIEELDKDSENLINLKISEIPYYFPNKVGSAEIKKNYKEVHSVDLCAPVIAMHVISENEIYAGCSDGNMFEIIDGEKKKPFKVSTSGAMEKIQALPEKKMAVLSSGQLNVWEFKNDTWEQDPIFRSMMKLVVLDFLALSTGEIAMTYISQDSTELQITKVFENNTIFSQHIITGEFKPIKIDVNFDQSIVTTGSDFSAHLRNIDGRYNFELISCDNGHYGRPIFVNQNRIAYTKSGEIYDFVYKEGEWDVDYSKFDSLNMTHTGANTLTPLLDGTLLSAGSGHSIKVWGSNDEVKEIRNPHTKEITAIKVLPSGKIVTASHDGRVKILDGE